MSWRWLWEQGTEALTLEIEPAFCPVCQKGLYRNTTFLSGGWGRCAVCTEVVHYTCLGGGKIFKHRPRICRDCQVGRVRDGQKMPFPLKPSAQSDAAGVGSAAAASEPVLHPPAISPARPEPAKKEGSSAIAPARPEPAKTGSLPTAPARPEPAKKEGSFPPDTPESDAPSGSPSSP
jgi:hypothetical protein